MERLCVVLCTLGLVGCLLPEIADEELGTLAPPCGNGWTVTADGRSCERARDGGTDDASSPHDGGLDDASTPEGDAGDGGSEELDSGALDAGTDAGADAGIEGCYQPSTSGVPTGAFVPTEPVINEFVFKHQTIGDVGTDYYEFVELYGPPDTDWSALTVLVISSHDGTNPGAIVRAVEVGTTNAAGFWRSCPGYESDDDSFPQASTTILLVRGFSAAEGYDLDSGNDGVFDVTPWDAILDSVAFEDSSAVSDVFYTTVRLSYSGYPGHDYVGSRLGASRVTDGVDTDAETDWRKNHHAGSGLPGVSGSPRAGEAYNTPGAPNRIQ